MMNKRITLLVAILLLGTLMFSQVNAEDVPEVKSAITKIHYRPAGGNLGDVQPFFWDGQYHVFYIGGAIWDHVVSDDLVHWKQLPTAIGLTGEEHADGHYCIWSGSVVEDNGTFHAFYTDGGPVGQQARICAKAGAAFRQ